MPAKDTIAAATEAQPVAAATAERASGAQFELELGPPQSARTQWPKITLGTMGQALEGAGSRAGSAAAGMVDRLFCVSSRVVCGDAGAGDRANLVGPLAGVEGARGRRGGGGRVGDGDSDSPEP